jgi:hypothetical protein
VPTARVPADEASHDPEDPLGHLLGSGPGRPLRLGGPQRRQERQPRRIRASASLTRRARTRPHGCSTSSGLRTRYLWTAFTTGARRGEVSALRENRFDFTRQQVRLARNYLVKQGQHIEKGLDKALTKAAKVVKRTVEATTDEITSELQEALKS